MALQSRQGVVVKLDLAAGHSPDFYYLVTRVEGEGFVDLGAVQKLQEDLLDYLVDASLWVLLNLTGELNDHVGVAERYDEAVLQNEVFLIVDTDEGS